MPFSVDEFVGDILKDVSVDETKKQVLIELAKNPTIAKRLEENQLRQSDFSKKQAEYADKLKKAQDYWDGLVSWKSEKEKEFSEKESQLKNKLGVPDDDLGEGNKGSRAVTDDQLRELAQQSVAYQNTIVRIGMQHLKDFNEVLDTDKLLEIAGKERVNINQAYDFYVKPKREEIQKAEFDKALTKAREEGAQEAIKNYKVPVSDQSLDSGQVHSLDGLNAPPEKKAQYGVMAAIEAYTQAAKSGKHASF